MYDALRVFHRSLYDTYQHIGFMIWVSMLWLIGILPVVTIGPVTAALFYTIYRKKEGHPVSPRDFWAGVRRFGKSGLLLTIVYVVIAVPSFFLFLLLLSVDALWGKVVAMVFVYVLVNVHLLMLYMMPLFVVQGLTEWTALVKRAFRLLSENIIFSFNMCIYILLVTLLTIVIPLLFTLWAGWIAVTMYNALLFLLHKYDPDQYDIDLHVRWRGTWKAWKE